MPIKYIIHTRHSQLLLVTFIRSMDNQEQQRGGFHGYRKQQQLSSKTDINVGFPAEIINGNSNGNNIINGTHHHNHHSDHQHNNNNNNNINNNNINNNNNECTVREQDRFMPIANVIRIMRKILPPHAKISDDAKETIQECVSEYISFITGEANERCQREQRKTITAEDVLWAMSKLGFDDYIEPLTLYLHRYRELEGDRGSIRSCEPLLKMTRAAMDQYAAFGPVFHIGPPPPHHPGYYGGPSSVNGYIKEASSAVSDAAAPTHSTTAAAASFEPYSHHK